MRKILLSGLVLATALFGYSQDEPGVSQEGKWFYDDFKGAEYSEPIGSGTDPDYFGMFWFGNDSVTQPGFKADLDRSPENGMDVTITQRFAEFQPFGFVFGDSNGDAPGGTPFTMDLSNVDKVEFRMKATNLSNYALKFRVALIDINGNLINTLRYDAYDQEVYNPITEDYNHPDYDPMFVYNGDFEMIMSAGSQGQVLTDISGEDFINMKGGWQKYWSQPDSSYRCRPCHDIGETFAYAQDRVDTNFYKTPNLSDFDYSQVRGMNFTIVNEEDTDNNSPDFIDATEYPDSAEFYNYQPYPIEDATVRIHYVALNAIPADVSGIADNAAQYGFTVYPSPTSDVISFTSDKGGDVKVVSAQGVTVATSTGSTIDVSTLADGLYNAVLVIDGQAVASETFVKQ